MVPDPLFSIPRMCMMLALRSGLGWPNATLFRPLALRRALRRALATSSTGSVGRRVAPPAGCVPGLPAVVAASLQPRCPAAAWHAAPSAAAVTVFRRMLALDASALPRTTSMPYNGVALSVRTCGMPAMQLRASLAALVARWRADGHSAAWLTAGVGEEDLAVVAEAARLGFRYHHAEGSEATLLLWLPTDRPCAVPPFATHQVRLERERERERKERGGEGGLERCIGREQGGEQAPSSPRVSLRKAWSRDATGRADLRWDRALRTAPLACPTPTSRTRSRCPCLPALPTYLPARPPALPSVSPIPPVVLSVRSASAAW